VKRLRVESVPIDRWTTTQWSLDILDGPAAGPVKTASFIPYSGQTGPEGVSEPLVVVESGSTPAPGSLAGKIAVFDVPLTIVPFSFFTALGYPNRLYDPAATLQPSQLYKRPYLNGVIPVLTTLQTAGAAAVVGVPDYPSDRADGSLRHIHALERYANHRASAPGVVRTPRVARGCHLPAPYPQRGILLNQSASAGGAAQE